MDSQQNQWRVYILRCADNTLYTGITTDLQRRLAEHNGEGAGGEGAGAKYTRSRRPVSLVYQEISSSRAEATRREYEIKRLNKAHKEQLISTCKG